MYEPAKVWEKDPSAPADTNARMKSALGRIKLKLIMFPAMTHQVYDGSREQRRQVRNFSSQLIGNYVRAAQLSDTLDGPAVIIADDAADEVRLLKYFARHYVIGLPALHAQQYGQKRIVRDLFSTFLNEGKAANLKLFPARLRYIWEDNGQDKPARLAADCIASLTENEAYQLHHRLMGTDSGIILDPIVR